MIIPGVIAVVKIWFRRLPEWMIEKLGDNTFLILASIVVGIISALAAVVLKIFVRFMHGVPDYFLKINHTPFLYLLFPLVGILLTVLFVQLFLKGNLERGLGSIIFSILRKSSYVDRSKTYTPIITSGITVGLGGSAGLEAPIVASASAIGANIAQALRLGYKERTLLLACGAASGIAAIFNSPIAGVIFAVEVLLIDLSVPLFIPLLISTATATILSKLLYSGQLFFLITTEWFLPALPYYILLGILCGFVSVYMTRTTLQIEGWFDARKQTWTKALLGGLALSLMIFLFPPLYGEGYTTITSLLNGSYQDIVTESFLFSWAESPWVLIAFGGTIILIKVIATSFTLGAGGNGGIFAPSLFTGAMTGFTLSFALNTLGMTRLQVSNFVAVGMAGIMAGVVHAPLTAIFLIAEITGGYMLFVPLMIVAAISFFISRYFEPYSIYTKNLTNKGYLMADSKDKNILNQLRLDDMIETGFVALKAHDNLGTLINAFTESQRNIFPVVDDNNLFIGVVHLAEVKKLMFRTELYNEVTIFELTNKEIMTLDVTEDVASALMKFENSDLWNIPVVDKGKYIGFISRSNMLSYYRKILKKSATLF
ncbi:MAG: chloride channel protein [Bacteroidales bacterium]|nr:chloride channel protein [Bacteroidales bacterium]